MWEATNQKTIFYNVCIRGKIFKSAHLMTFDNHRESDKKLFKTQNAFFFSGLKYHDVSWRTGGTPLDSTGFDYNKYIYASHS